METTRTPESRCPHCNHSVDAATSVEEARKPKPGDITVCAYCGWICVFDSQIHLKNLGPWEMEWLAKNRTQYDLLLAIQKKIWRRKSSL